MSGAAQPALAASVSPTIAYTIGSGHGCIERRRVAPRPQQGPTATTTDSVEVLACRFLECPSTARLRALAASAPHLTSASISRALGLSSEAVLRWANRNVPKLAAIHIARLATNPTYVAPQEKSLELMEWIGRGLKARETKYIREQITPAPTTARRTAAPAPKTVKLLKRAKRSNRITPESVGRRLVQAAQGTVIQSAVRGASSLSDYAARSVARKIVYLGFLMEHPKAFARRANRHCGV